MTIAEKNQARKDRVDDLLNRIRVILERYSEPLELEEIIHYLQSDRLSKNEPLDSDNPYDVRDAVNKMVRTGIAVEVEGRDIALNASR